MRPGPRVAGVVLAAGSASRFGGPKLLAPLAGRPLLEHVLVAARVAGLAEVVVVLGGWASELESGIAWRGERRVVNPDPSAGILSSLRAGLAALGPDVDAAVVLLGDQPLLRPAVIRALVERAGTSRRPIVVPRYAVGGGQNPVLVRREAWPMAAAAEGDRGLGPTIAAHLELVEEVAVPGALSDVDTPADLAMVAVSASAASSTGIAPADLAAMAGGVPIPAMAHHPTMPDLLRPSAVDVFAAWAARVRTNAEQVERVREVADPPDFYGPTASFFRADPRRLDEPLLDDLVSFARPDDRWLDIGAGAGRYALPLALAVREVVAVEPSPGMAASLREAMVEHGIANVTVIEGGWPPEEPGTGAPIADPPRTDVALVAHLGYDIERLGPFLHAMEAAATRLCAAVLTERQPSSVADPFWPIVHGEERIALPALREFLVVLMALGRSFEVRLHDRTPRAFESEDEAIGFLRRQLWVAEGGEKDARFVTAARERLVERDGRIVLRDQPTGSVGLVTWAPGRRVAPDDGAP